MSPASRGDARRLLPSAHAGRLLVLAVALAVAAIAPNAASAKGINSVFIFPPSPTGANGWYTVSPTASLVFDVDGFTGSDSGDYTERAVSATNCTEAASLPTFPTLNSFGVSLSLPPGFQGMTALICEINYTRQDRIPPCFFTCTLGPEHSIGSEQFAVAVKVDSVAPYNVTPHPASAANANGWYRTPVNVSWSGQDATSGIQVCNSGPPWGPPGGLNIGPPD
jgi:hypothetical protein